MNIAATGFVSEQAGSVASANALFLRDLIARGHEIDFYSKSSFVDPRSAVGASPGFRFLDTTNSLADGVRRSVERVPVLGFAAGRWDCETYVDLLQRSMTREHQASARGYDLILWLGDYAWRRVRGVPQVSFVQGPPGTDARSVVGRFAEVRRVAGFPVALKLAAMARLRLSRIGLPPFQNTDHFIVGSGQSKRTLVERYGILNDRVSTLPYPIDLELFQPTTRNQEPRTRTLHVLWLGRVGPRKRLDLFLDGAALAIRDGLDLNLTIVGGAGLVPGYEKLIAAFPFPDRLTWIRGIPRNEVPALLHRHDVLCQPSDEENFGSSVSEAQACGLPVIVGRTNGNADYLCSRDTHLADDRPETLASVFRDYAERKARGGEAWGTSAESRALAEREFAVESVTGRLEEILRAVVGNRESGIGNRGHPPR